VPAIAERLEMQLIAWLQSSIDFPSQLDVATDTCSVYGIWQENLRTIYFVIEIYFRYSFIRQIEIIRKRIIEPCTLKCVKCETVTSDCPSANMT
jgi:hypothetical protein